MIVNKHFKTYLRLKRFFRPSYMFRKCMGVTKELLDKEERIINQLFFSLSYTKRDKGLAERLSLELSEKEIAEGKNYPKFILEKSKNHYKYFVQGNTDNINLYVNIENKKLPCWSMFEKCLRATPFYYFLFNISYTLTDKREEKNFVVFGTEIDYMIEFMKIYNEEEYGTERMCRRSNEVFMRNLKAAEVAVDTLCKEVLEIKEKVKEEALA